MAKPVHLEVNDSGGWRRVMTFDADDGDEVLHLFDQMLRRSINGRLKARVSMPGTLEALQTWHREHGWRVWVHPCDRQPEPLL